MSAAASTLTQADHEWKPKTNPWLIAFVVSLAAFMEVLDTSIANVALPHIAGNLGASQDQSTWVLTSYLVSNAIVLPISGWLVSVFGRKRFFMTCIVIFTVSSLACGVAPSLPILLVARVVRVRRDARVRRVNLALGLSALWSSEWPIRSGFLPSEGAAGPGSA